MLPADAGPPRTLHGHEFFPPADLAVMAHVYKTSRGIAPHGHDFVEIAVIGGGTGRHISAPGSRPVGVGDVIVLRPGAWHRFADCHRLVVADTCLAPSVLRDDLAFLHDVAAIRDLVWREPAAAGRYGVYVTSIPEHAAAATVHEVAALQSALAHSPVNRTLLLSRLLGVLGSLVDHLDETPSPHAVHPGIAAVLARLDSEPERDWRLHELAAHAQLDRAYLCRLFRRHVGQPPMAYLARVRAERAAELLTRTDEPMSRIGAQVGWPDPAHFARRFRDLSGLSPTAYRRRFTPR